MTKQVVPLLIVSIGLFCGPATLLGADFKVGFVNAARVIDEAPQTKAALKSLEQEFSPRDRQLVALQKSFKKEEERLVRDGAVMSDTERRNLEREIRLKKREFKRAQDEFREDLSIRRNEVLAQLQREAVETVRTLAQKQRYDLILSDGVVYASDRVDITSDVLERLQEEHRKNPSRK